MSQGSPMNRRQKTGFDERNIARLGLILSPNRIDEQMSGWHKFISLPGQPPINVLCLAGASGVVPHGLDGDLMYALISLYAQQNAGDSPTAHRRKIRTTLAELADRMGVERGGKIYERIELGLRRLSETTFHAIGCWMIGHQKMMVEHRSFRFINGFLSEHVADLESPETTKFTPNKTYVIELSDVVTVSIDEGYTRRLDHEFYSALKRPLSRIIYRTLEEWRVTRGEFDVIQVSFQEWIEHLGLRRLAQGAPQEVPIGSARVSVPKTKLYTAVEAKKALKEAHLELVRRGYFQPPEFTGRGVHQIVTFRFTTPEGALPVSPVPTALEDEAFLAAVRALTQRGIATGAARTLARQVSPESVRVASQLFDAYAGKPPRNRGGLMRDMLLHPEKYEVDTSMALPLLNGVKEERAAARRSRQDEAEQPSRPTVKTIRFLLRGLPKELHDLGARIEEMYLAGEISAERVTELIKLEPADARLRLYSWPAG